MTGFGTPTGVSAQPVLPNTAPSSIGAFDPYAPTFRPSTAPVFGSPNWNLGNLFGLSNAPANPMPPSWPSTGFGQPITTPNSTFGAPYGNAVYPNQNPGVLFPGTGAAQPMNAPWTFQPNTNPYGNPYAYPPGTTNWNNWWSSTTTNLGVQTNQVIRLFQGPRLRHTWLPGTGNFDGKKQNAVESNDTDVSLVFAVPSFLGSGRPLYIIPSYSQHLWDGPVELASDLPGSAFSGFIDIGWESNPLQTLGAELGLRVGVFSAFDAINSESLRFPGKALARLRLTPTSTVRAGVYYLDRNKIKLLPAVGLLWAPNPDTRFDIFFPEPKLSHYLSTLGNTDVWWYLTGYYGGGAWTIKRADGTNDEFDLNDIRLMLGFEYGRSDQLRQGFRVAFVEGGYAFNRELIYRNNGDDDTSLENSFVVRAGFAY